MTYRSPIGVLEVGFCGAALASLRLCGDCPPGATAGCSPAEDGVRRWLDCYFSGRDPGFVPPLALRGTAFQRRVWRELLAIPYGHTTTYGELAHRVGCRSARAVGQAVGRNPVAIVVPCHRVVAADGLGGYAYGCDVKRALLAMERCGDGE